jgi:phenylpropionate dioxygenase-like ring-hydroxylating dioxygenase large terminal subunit
VLVPFTWKVTGWFMIGWSPEFPIGEVRPLHYFGEDLVAYRDEHGQLRVLDAHCKLSKVDAKGYMVLRKWATQFYEVPA